MERDNVYAQVTRAMRGQARSVLVFSFFANVLVLTSSIYMLQVFDRVLASGSTPTLVWLTAIALIALVVFGVLEHVRKGVLSATGGWFEDRLSRPVLARATRLRARGEPVRGSLADVEDVRRFVGGDGALAFLDAPWMPLFIAVIWLLHPLLGWIALGGAVTLFALALLNDFVTRSGNAAGSVAARDRRREAQQILDEADTVAPLGMLDGLLTNWERRQAVGRRDGREAGRATAAISVVSKVLRLGLQVGILGAGAWLVLQGQLTAGGMIAASIILARALSPVERSIGAWRTFVAARAAHRRLVAFFAGGEQREQTRLPAPRGHVSLENVRWFPAGSVDQVLNNVSFDIEPGQTLGVIGPTGSGKTTLCRLITGSLTPTIGKVRLDGASLDNWNVDQLAEYVGYLPQEVTLFPGTVAENIARMAECSDEEVVEAAKLADCHELILNLPKGYDTDVGQHGSLLSGGQRQRIGLARALFRNPRLIVLDEPNSSLDAEGEKALAASLERLKAEGRTIVLVAHQPSMLRTADLVLILRDGRVAAFGQRDDVLGRRSLAAPEHDAVERTGGPRRVAKAKQIRPAAAALPGE